MSDLVELYDIKVSDGYELRTKIIKNLNRFYSCMMDASEEWECRFRYNQIIECLHFCCLLGLISHNKNNNLQRRLEDDFKRKICTY